MGEREAVSVTRIYQNLGETRSPAQRLTILTEEIPYLRSVSIGWGDWGSRHAACSLGHLSPLDICSSKHGRRDAHYRQLIDSIGGHECLHRQREHVLLRAHPRRVVHHGRLLSDLILRPTFLGEARPRAQSHP